MTAVATFNAINPYNWSERTEINVYFYDGKFYADSDHLGMGHKFDAERNNPHQVAAELARRHGFILA